MYGMPRGGYIPQEIEGIVVLVVCTNEEHWLRIKYWSELEALRYSSDEINISVRFAMSLIPEAG